MCIFSHIFCIYFAYSRIFSAYFCIFLHMLAYFCIFLIGPNPASPVSVRSYSVPACPTTTCSFKLFIARKRVRIARFGQRLGRLVQAALIQVFHCRRCAASPGPCLLLRFCSWVLCSQPRFPSCSQLLTCSVRRVLGFDYF